MKVTDDDRWKIACEAANQHFNHGSPVWEDYRDAFLDGYIAAERHALERAAKVADSHATNAWEIASTKGQNSVCASGRNHAGREIAQAIRALGDE